MKSKRILLISTEFPPAPGGIGSHAFYLIKELRKLGWEITVASEQSGTENAEIDTFNARSEYPVFRLFPVPNMPLLIKKILFLLKLCIQKNPSIIVGTGKHGSWFAYFISRIMFKKCVLIGHGTEFTLLQSNRSKNLNEWIYSKCDTLIHVSNFTMKTAESVGIKNKKTYVIHNGADADFFKRLSAENIELFTKEQTLENQKIILTVGNMSDRKGQEWVIRAMPMVVSKVPSAHYYCVGLPSWQQKFQNISNEIGIEKHIHFLGKRDILEVVKWMNSCDIFAMTSAQKNGDFEGFGIAVIEAALCGKPSVVTNQSGLAEAIIEGETGLGVK